MGEGDQALERAEVVLAQADALDRHRLRAGEDAEDHVLVVVDGGDGGDAELDQLVLGVEADLAVLRLAALGDVELGHDLQARDQRAPVLRGDLPVGDAVTVDAEADDRAALAAVGLEVDVGGARGVGIHDDLVGELDDRAVVLLDLDRARGVGVLEALLLSAELLEDAIEAGEALADLLVEQLIEAGLELAPGHHHLADLPAGHGAELIGRLGGERIADGHGERVIVEIDGQGVEPGDDPGVDLLEGQGVDRALVEIDEGEAEFSGQRDGELLLRDGLHLDQDVAEPGARSPLLLAQRGLDLRGAGEALLHQDLAELAAVAILDRQRVLEPAAIDALLFEEDLADGLAAAGVEREEAALEISGREHAVGDEHRAEQLGILDAVDAVGVEEELVEGARRIVGHGVEAEGLLEGADAGLDEQRASAGEVDLAHHAIAIEALGSAERGALKGHEGDALGGEGDTGGAGVAAADLDDQIGIARREAGDAAHAGGAVEETDRDQVGSEAIGDHGGGAPGLG